MHFRCGHVSSLRRSLATFWNHAPRSGDARPSSKVIFHRITVLTTTDYCFRVSLVERRSTAMAARLVIL
jgi:hypothetical protein